MKRKGNHKASGYCGEASPQVECYSGYREGETPRTVIIGGIRHRVVEIVSRKRVRENRSGLTRSPTLSSAFPGGDEKRGSGLTPNKPRQSCRGIDGLTFELFDCRLEDGRSLELERTEAGSWRIRKPALPSARKGG